MHRIVVRTIIKAPPLVVFDLTRDIRVHVRSVATTGEKVIAASRDGKLELGDTVTFVGNHFGIRWRFTAKVVEMRPPESFVDEQVSGPFRKFRHEHRFVVEPDGTSMVDIVEFESPIAGLIIGWHLKRFLTARGQFLKRLAEEP